tara:strand:- start:3654 stop:3803 length:150 start_codon:yes stop_codon:yes gene_type:complete
LKRVKAVSIPDIQAALVSRREGVLAMPSRNAIPVNMLNAAARKIPAQSA